MWGRRSPGCSEKDTKLAQNLGQLQPFTGYSCIRSIPYGNTWADLHLLGQPNTVLVMEAMENMGCAMELRYGNNTGWPPTCKLCFLEQRISAISRNTATMIIKGKKVDEIQGFTARLRP